MRTVNAIKFDILFQLRHGFYYAYLFVTAIYVLALLNLPESIRPTVTILLLFTDTTMLGFFFIGAIVLLEKSQNIHESLFVTPLRVSEYFFSKVFSLMILSILSSLIIALAANGKIHNFLLFTIGLILTSCFFTLSGFVFASRAKNVNDYFARALGMGLGLSLPIMGFFHVFETPIYYLFPTQATLIFLNAAFVETKSSELIYALVCLILWTGVAARMAYLAFEKHIILKIGGRQ